MDQHPFFAYLSRMRYINRWGLMRNTFQENIQEHSHMVAVHAHALAVIRWDVFGREADPGLAAMAALRAGETTAIVNAGRLRIKESDRLATVTEVLNALGAQVEEHEDHLVIHGREKQAGGVTVSGHNDHRIAMMAAIAAIRCEKPVTIIGAECVKKSYPRFWEDYEALGGLVQKT